MKFIEIEQGLSINFDLVTSISVEKDMTEIVLGDGEKFISKIPYNTLKQLLSSNSNDSSKYLKQLAQNQRFVTP